jgi:hypothetical protein
MRRRKRTSEREADVARRGEARRVREGCSEATGTLCLVHDHPGALQSIDGTRGVGAHIVSRMTSEAELMSKEGHRFPQSFNASCYMRHG